MTGAGGDRVPILQVGAFLLVTLQTELSDPVAVRLQEDLLERIRSSGARGVLIDISSLLVVDSFIGRLLGEIGAMAALLGARTVLTGMQPAVAITLVELGVQLENVGTALDVDRGLALLQARVAESNG